MRQDLTTADVSARLRIMEDHIRNIENAVVDQLPTHTYIIGYVRSYASMLGLDAASLCAQLRDSLTTDEKNPDFNFVENKVTTRVGNGRVALVALLAGFLIYGGWYGISTGLVGGDPSASSGDVASVAIDTTRPVVATEGNSPPQDVAAVEPEFVEVEPRVADAPAVAELKPEAAPDAGNAEDNTVTPLEDAAASPLTSTPTVTAQAPATETVTKVTEAQAINRVPGREITLKATSSSWVKVTRADGSEVTAKLMRAGDTYVVPSGEDLYLTTGNAGGLNLSLGDDAPITLGAWGETLSELALDETVINQRY
ncbi:MAG: DUF4115 domain-containing protein [Alphaproteobacteria bacterium]|nr:DUF4115 domain-containing protein [Alphaproteobacteria bacterium]